ncbi:MAG: 50S ribosomal protein L11 methyltransferase, partial [Campylobacterota bacterium]
AKLGACVDLCDSDEQAIDSTKSNFSLNNLAYNNAWVGSVDQVTKQYDVVVANIIADVLLLLYDKIQNTLKVDGILILSGILDNKAQAVIDRYADLQLVDKIEKDEWVTLVYRGVNEKFKQ